MSPVSPKEPKTDASQMREEGLLFFTAMGIGRTGQEALDRPGQAVSG